MATYYPITGSVTQYQKSNGGFALNYYLKFYAAGTSTAISCAPNASATDPNNVPQLLDKVRINEKGYPVNPTGGEMIPHIDQTFKLVLYKNAADANADNTSAAEWVVDNLSPGLVGFSLTQNDQDATEIDYIADDTATTRKLDTRLQERVSVLDFAADPTGNTDSTTAFETALLASKDVYVPTGTYLMDGIKVLRDEQNIHFGANVNLLAASNNAIMLWQTSSFCSHTGRVQFSANGFSGVWGCCIGPADLSSLLVIDDQRRNTMPEMIMNNGEEVLVFHPGPEVSGSVSFCTDNYIPLVSSTGANRVVYFKPPPNAGGYRARGNHIRNVLANGSSINTGIHIESGSYNSIEKIKCINLASNGSPNAIATGVLVDAVCPVTGFDNSYNCITSGISLSNSRDVENGASTTYLLAVNFSTSNSLLTAQPRTVS